MRAIIQRVLQASVTIEQNTYSEIGNGLLVLVGVEENDDEQDANYIANKIVQMRIFSDDNGKMNRNIQDIKGEILIVSQFTLIADTKKGNRPSFIRAARPEKAIPLYELVIEKMQYEVNKKIKTGVFSADMKVQLINDGPVSIIIDSKNK